MGSTRAGQPAQSRRSGPHTGASKVRSKVKSGCRTCKYVSWPCRPSIHLDPPPAYDNQGSEKSSATRAVPHAHDACQPAAPVTATESGAAAAAEGEGEESRTRVGTRSHEQRRPLRPPPPSRPRPRQPGPPARGRRPGLPGGAVLPRVVPPARRPQDSGRLPAALLGRAGPARGAARAGRVPRRAGPGLGPQAGERRRARAGAVRTAASSRPLLV